MSVDIVQGANDPDIYSHFYTNKQNYLFCYQTHPTQQWLTCCIDPIHKKKKKKPSEPENKVDKILLQSQEGKPCGSAHVCMSAARVTVVATLINKSKISIHVSSL